MTAATVSCATQTFGGSVLRSRPMFRFARRPTPGATEANSSRPSSPSSAGAYLTRRPVTFLVRRCVFSMRACTRLPAARPILAPRWDNWLKKVDTWDSPLSSSPPGTSTGLPHLGHGTRRPALASGAFSFLPHDEQ